MITVEQAQNYIDAQIRNWGTEKVKLEKSISRILAQEVHTDRDMPPYDRVSMDGIAIKFEDFTKGIKTYHIAGVSAAGDPQTRLEKSGSCLEVMTGGVMPLDADVMIRYEDLHIANGKATVQVDTIKQYQNIHFRGSNQKKGTLIASTGQLIKSPLVNGLATFGLTEIQVKRLPQVAVISTGDELIPVDATPLPHQIRQSNNYMIQSALQTTGIQANIYHLKDDKEIIKPALEQILVTYDIVILSGGVSMGKFDFIPQMLERAGVRCHFHKVTQRPGKPLWFGSKDNGPIVFGLPGNPASTCVCLHTYVIPYLEKCIKGSYATQKAILTGAIKFAKPLTYYALVTTHEKDGQRYVTPSLGAGSGDLANLTKVHGCIQLEKEKDHFARGEVVSFYPFL